MAVVILGPAAAAEAVCHDEQLRIWADDHIIAALAMGHFLRDDLEYHEVIELGETVKREIKSIIASAFDHPEVRSIRRMTGEVS